MRLLLVFLCLAAWGACQSGDGETVESCPTFAGNLETLESELGAFLEDMTTGEHRDLIINGSLVNSDLFLTPTILTPLTPTSLTLHLLTPNASQPLYAAVSVWSLDTSVSPSGCATPSLAPLVPGADTEVLLQLACSSVDSAVVMQLCVTVGNDSFSTLSGAYTTYTINLRRMCDGTTSSACIVADRNKAVPVEFCASRDQLRRLAVSGVGEWRIFVSSFGGNEDQGYCLVDKVSEGINGVFRTEALALRFPIPESFPAINVYIDSTDRSVGSSTAFTFAVTLRAENESVVGEPYVIPPSPSSGPSNSRLYGSVALPCLSPGVTKVNIQFNSSGFINDILYRRDFSLFFYRNCTPDLNSTLLVINTDHNLSLLVGLPVALITVTIAMLLVVIAAVMVYVTRRYKHKSYMMEQQETLDLLSFSNAYVQSRFEDPFKFLSEYDIEYNYASLEVVGMLGEGAFGRVFKARAPGIHRGDYVPQEFVAVKTLKEGATDDVQTAFRSEVKVCVQFEHSNVIRLVGVCTKAPHRCMVFEYMDVGGLDGLLRRSDPSSPDHTDTDTHITPTHFLPIALQVAAGLEYLADLKFVHRDVASRNCLVDHALTVKIADFGMSRETNAMDYYRIGSTKACLPVRWMPPEALLYGKFTVKSDVWSFGVLVWEVYTYGHQPFSGLSNHEVIDKVKGGGCLDCPQLCTAPVYAVLQSTWTRVPSRRPTISVVRGRLRQLLSGGALDEGYLNMGFGTLPTPDELEEAKKVADDSLIVTNGDKSTVAKGERSTEKHSEIATS